MTASPAIRGTLSSSSAVTEATLKALNGLVGDQAKFLLVGDKDADKTLVVEYRNAAECAKWCNNMNLHVFPNERGVMVGNHQDSAAIALGPMFRFPESFWNLVKYIADEEVFYNELEDKWDAVEEMKREGQWDLTNLGREQFVVWMKRQIAILKNAF